MGEHAASATARWPDPLGRLARGWPTIALAGGVAAVAAGGLWWSEGVRYRAEATLALTRPDATIAFDERFRSAPLDPAFPYRIGSIRTYPELASTEDIAARVREALGDRVPADWTAAKLSRHVRVAAAAEGTLLVVEAGAANPEVAADVANTWARVFSERMEALLGEAAQAGAGASDVAAASDGAAGVDPAPSSEGGTGGLPAAQATARAALDVAETRLEAFHAEAAIDARAAEEAVVEERYRSLLERRYRLEDVAREAERLAARIEAGEPSGADEALALLVLRYEALRGDAANPSAGGTGASGGSSLRLDAALGNAPSAADLRSLAADAAAAAQDVALQAEGLPEALAEARATVAVLSHDRSDLERERDLAAERLLTLGRRAAEVEAALATARPELRLVAAAVPPEGMDAGALARRALSAFILGLLAGAVLVLRPWRAARASLRA